VCKCFSKDQTASKNLALSDDYVLRLKKKKQPKLSTFFIDYNLADETPKLDEHTNKTIILMDAT
jgi:hypothetical protein